MNWLNLSELKIYIYKDYLLDIDRIRSDIKFKIQFSVLLLTTTQEINYENNNRFTYYLLNKKIHLSNNLLIDF